MRAAFATLALAGLAVANPVANPIPSAVTSVIAPSGSPPAGCYENYDGTFLIGPVNVSSSSKRDVDEIGFEIIETRNTQLGISLKAGILTDPQGRTGYIAANEQFQFDGPPQAGAIWTGGFSVCENKRLALGSTDIWWKCLSGDFYNLYFKTQGGQCIKSYLITRPEGGQGGPVSGGSSATPVITGTASGSASASGAANATASASSSGATNGTATASGSSSASASASSSGTTVVGGGHHTTTTTGGRTITTGGGHQTTATTGGGGGTATMGGGAASSSSSPAAAPLATLKSEMFGLAAGVLALAAL